MRAIGSIFFAFLLATFSAGRLGAAPLAISSPSNRAVVTQLKPVQARVASESWQECRRYFDKGELSRSITVDGCHPERICLSWKGGVGPYEVVLRRLPDGREFFRGKTEKRRVYVDSLEIARRWEWTLADSLGASAKGEFSTADAAPRLIRIEGVPNVRDLGGRITADGHRVRQGLLFRSAGLNHNSYKKDGNMVHGGKRLSPAERSRINSLYAIRTDLDLRRPDEVFGMTASPLGESVKWINLRYTTYGALTNRSSLARARQIYREMLNTNNYPLVFHCIAGADRTGTLALVMNGLLGVSRDDALKDYLATGYKDYGITDPRHLRMLDDFLAAVDSYPGKTFQEKIESHFKSLGFAEEELDGYRRFMLERKEEEVGR
jgi:protein-tyrosine phosphatase